MKRPIRVLILEDKPSDMELALLELRRAGFDPEWECVETEEGFLDSLQRDFDIILSDYAMPEFDGLRALALLKRRGLETPFILVSGTIGEETAVAAMKQGATDYLLKDRLARLGPAVTQALEQNRLRKENVCAEEALRDSEERFRQLAENIQEVFWLTDPTKNVILYVSPAYETIWGRSRAGIYASAVSWLDSIHSDDKEAVHRAAVTKQAAGTYDEEYRIVRPDGSIRWIHDRAFPVRNGAGDIYRVVGVARDITERKEAEVVLRESDRRFREMLENVELIAMTLDQKGMVTFCNDYLLRVTGWTREEVIGADWFSKFIPDQHRALRKHFVENIEAGEIPSHHENPMGTSSGQLREIAWNNTMLRDTAGKIVGTASLGEDVTDRKRAETRVRESEERMRSVMESALDCVITMDDQGKVVEFNPAAERTFSYTRNEAIGRLLSDLIIPPALRERHQRGLKHYLATNEGPVLGKRVELMGMRKDNSEFPLELAITRMGSQEPPMFTGFIRDITERKLSEDRLREQAKLLDLAQDAIMVRDMEDHVEFWNHGAENLYGWMAGEVRGEKASGFLYRDEPAATAAALTALIENGTWTGECQHNCRNGGSVTVRSRWTLVRDEFAAPKSILSINTDITEQKKIEKQFLRAQRLESIGTLASGVAHDLNNILVPILMAAPLLRDNMPEIEREKLLAIVQSSAERGANIVQQVLTFARGADGNRVLLQPIYLVQEIAKIAEETFPKSMAIRTNYPEDLWTIVADPTQLHQILLNLCINARDAMPTGGTLTLALENFDVDDHYASMTPGAKAGPHVLLKVSDTGIGIPRETIDKIFDPFFTTKQLGQGTGLGLSTVIGIVKSHGGFMQVYSEVGRGTSFKVFLPANTSELADAETPEAEPLPPPNDELLLIVDDEKCILQVARTILEDHGYRVLTAADATEALAIFALRMNEIGLVLTDLAMPFMDGVALIRTLQKMKPDVRVIASTGRGDQDERANEIAHLNVRANLTKPYNKNKLLTTLHDVLTKAPDSQTKNVPAIIDLPVPINTSNLHYSPSRAQIPA
jgi:PAS domain S-box-containing protein